MWEKGYRLLFLEGDGKDTKVFSGEQMYAATFVKN